MTWFLEFLFVVFVVIMCAFWDVFDIVSVYLLLGQTLFSYNAGFYRLMWCFVFRVSRDCSDDMLDSTVQRRV